ncbi:phospholipase A2 inhibitor and Ly6/PLAUR domain-containing protein-like [Bufo gargarizans]|uniref:phospholipase A2 inhibitor and Ly6/PLAUR domain-containing protein-like n=1 Tax=Bufo gargarizans TaxID=30331 RepID=UPI001CF2CCEE|nr:phospholipase A2 inhibitor and Ly6/PLAUR domain-containing protein-like [Bufo gargarizans]
MATTCCSEDRCTSAKPIVPDASSQPNGLKCPKCALLSESCGTLESMNCMGDQTMCLLVTTKKTTGSINVTKINRGCASEGLCYQKNQTSKDGEVYTEKTYSCSQGTRSSEASYTSSVKTVCSSELSVIVLLMLYNLCF